MPKSEHQLDKIEKCLKNVEFFSPLEIGEDDFVSEVMPMIQKYSQLVKAESIDKALLSKCVVAGA